MECNWYDLGNVTVVGNYLINGIGNVYVMQKDIDEAKAMGGNPKLKLKDVTGNQTIPEYRIIRIIPMNAKTTLYQWHDIGNVDVPGYYHIDGIGIIAITQTDIDTVMASGDNPNLKLMSTNMPTYKIAEIISTEE